MRLKLEISSDYLRVFLSGLTEEGKEKQDPVKREEIDLLLSNQKITFGINEDEIKNVIGKKEEFRDVVIAEGIAPTTGKGAEVKLLKKAKRLDEVMPIANENGDIDYISPREGWLVAVKKGEEIAVKLPPTQGKDGQNIFGKEIPGIWGSDFNLDDIGGLNTEADHENLLAKADGFIGQHAAKIIVDPIYRIYESIGPSTGSIDIPLDYDITIQTSRDIQAGYSVKARNVIVGGCVEDAYVESEKLIVEQGIVGTSEIPIRSAKIQVGYINGSRKIYSDAIHVMREISSGPTIYASQVKAGTIQGSVVYASEAIWTGNMNGQNKAYIGIDYKAKLTVENCTRELNKMEEPLEQLQKAWNNAEKKMAYLKELSKKNPQHPLLAKELPQIKEIKDKYAHYMKKKQELEKERDEASEKMYPSMNPFILVRNGFARDVSTGSIVEPDSLINFRSEIRKIMEPRSRLYLTVVKGEVVSGTNVNLKELKTRLNKLDF